MLRYVPYFFLPYRSFAEPMLVFAGVALPVWLVFRLYRHRTSEHPASLGREILLAIVVVYLAAVASATLTPNYSSHASEQAAVAIDLHPRLSALTCLSASLPIGSRARFFCMHNARGNVLLFLPLGILIPLVGRRLRFGSAMLIAIALSVTIELIQYITSSWGHRHADINDVILNSAGAFIGLLLVSLLRLIPRTRRPAAAT